MEKKDVWYPGKDADKDEHHGVGGTYEYRDGKRVLVEGSRTERLPPAEQKTEAKE